jgi:hypothetical protein
MKLKIAIAYHKKSLYVTDSRYLPIQVGATFSDEDLGIQKDSEGDNISEMNPYCCELSATYWLWKHIQDADYYGLCHYRRFFSKRQPTLWQRMPGFLVYWCSKLLAPWVVDARYTLGYSDGQPVAEDEADVNAKEFADYMLSVVAQSPVDARLCFCLQKIRLSTYSCQTKLMKAIGLYNYNKLDRIIAEQHPAFYPYFVRTMAAHEYNPCNMIIAEKHIFEEYAGLLFSIIGEYHAWVTEGLQRGRVNSAALRISGYMGEFITSAFLLYLREQKNVTVRELYQKSIEIASTGLSHPVRSVQARIRSIFTPPHYRCNSLEINKLGSVEWPSEERRAA